MKRLLAILISIICLSICYEANAQNNTNIKDAVYLVSNPQTARWSYIETDSNGNMTATIYYSVESIDGDGMNGKLKLLVKEVPVASPKDTVKSFHFYRFKDGEFMVDVNSGFEDMVFDGNKLDELVNKTINEKYQDLPEEKKMELLEKTKAEFFKTSGEIRGIPRNPQVGKLPDYDFHIKINIISMKVQGEDRRIVGRESIQTKAGLFDCFILEETVTTKVTIMKEVEKIKSWYAYGIGLVKEITYDKHGKLVSTMILKEIVDNN